jgi:hypothetical protein
MPRYPALKNYGPHRQVQIPDDQVSKKIRVGSFSKVRGVCLNGALIANEFVYCRENFQTQSRGIRRILFGVPKGKRAYAVAAFMHKIETKLKLKERSCFGPTQRLGIMWIVASPWWTQSGMKRSLFTILLRCGVNYKPLKDNFEQALFSTEYTKKTEYAVRRFLRGHTRYTGRLTGWYKQFRWGGGSYYSPRHLIPKEVRKLLR